MDGTRLMGMFRSRRLTGHAEPVVIDISERQGVRYLHLGSETVQSAMRLANPFELVLPYTHCMMAFLLFKPAPARVTVLGLGGASLPKFMYKHLPQTVVESVELHPEVVAAAHSMFAMPDDEARLPVHIGDGGAFIAGQQAHSDVVMVDGFGSHKLADNLCSDAFYRNARTFLTSDGMLVANLWRSSPQFNMLVERIGQVFEQRVLLLPDFKHGNTIVFAFQRSQDDPSLDVLRARAEALEGSTGLPFIELTERLRQENLHSATSLTI